MKSDDDALQKNPQAPDRLGGLSNLADFNLRKGGLAGGGVGILALLVFVLIRLLAGNSTSPTSPAGVLSSTVSSVAPTHTG